jgi:hypothetical protein
MYRWFWKSRIFFFFAGKTYNWAKIALRYAQDNLGVKKVSAPSENPKKCPIISFAPDKKIISRTFKIRGTLVFLCPKEREREKERERKREREQEQEQEQERDWEQEEEQERERQQEREREQEQEQEQEQD